MHAEHRCLKCHKGYNMALTPIQGGKSVQSVNNTEKDIPSSEVVNPSKVDFNREAGELVALVKGGSKAISEITRRSIEKLMEVKGLENLAKLTEPWQRHIEGTLENMPKGVRDGARYALTQTILTKIPEAKA